MNYNDLIHHMTNVDLKIQSNRTFANFEKLETKLIRVLNYFFLIDFIWYVSRLFSFFMHFCFKIFIGKCCFRTFYQLLRIYFLCFLIFFLIYHFVFLLCLFVLFQIKFKNCLYPSAICRNTLFMDFVIKHTFKVEIAILTINAHLYDTKDAISG